MTKKKYKFNSDTLSYERVGISFKEKAGKITAYISTSLAIALIMVFVFLSFYETPRTKASVSYTHLDVYKRQALSPVIASIRRTPAAIALSDTILNRPICPVAFTCVPPHSSTDSPKRITRTESPYFSPNSIIAPISLACCNGISLSSSCGEFSLILLLTKASVCAIRCV